MSDALYLPHPLTGPELLAALATVDRATLAAALASLPTVDAPAGLALLREATPLAIQIALGVTPPPGTNVGRYGGQVYAFNHFH